jgi:hypothetical protein
MTVMRFARFVRLMAVIPFTILMAAGCAPKYDWRMVANSDGGFSAVFPAKPDLVRRNIAVAGHPLEMQMQSARAGGVVFAIGFVSLPSDDPLMRQQVLDFVQDGLAHNIGTHSAPQPVRVPAGNAGAYVDGVEWRASGTVPNQNVHREVRARFFARGKQVFELVMISAAPPPADQAEQFFDSFRLD